jgi:uncharacterized protein DUF5681
MSARRRDDKVGYRNPPHHSRFKKGQCGNPHGRPKGAKNLFTLVEEIASEKVRTTENGQARLISRLEKTLRQLVSSAEKGKPQQLRQFIALLLGLEGRKEALASPTDSLTDADREVIAQIYARFKLYGGGDDA